MNPPVTSEYQLFDLQLAEDEWKRILTAALSTPAQPVQVTMTHEGITESTPRVQLVLRTQQVLSQKFILNPAQTLTQFQPFNSWNYTLTATVTTNRETNGVLLRQLVAKTRLALQYYKLAAAWQGQFHAPVDSVEQSMDLTVEQDANTDSVTLTFGGVLSILNTAWITRAAVVLFTFLQPGGLFTYLSPSGGHYYQP